ncbi:hypothetical protein B0J17DRAFT_643742 [Rhizoctonia solani]|nr:hypothetical protein B0J17DRAFT_643742 [Rhizoctonia solani]
MSVGIMWLWLVRNEPALECARTCVRRAPSGDLPRSRQELWTTGRYCTEVGGMDGIQAKRLKFGNKQRSQ